MSMNFAFGVSLFLLILVGFNVYFFYTLSSVGKRGELILTTAKTDLTPNINKDIYHYLNYLPNQYKTKNPRYKKHQRDLVNSFNFSSNNVFNPKDIWLDTEKWSSEESLFPQNNGAPGKILQAMRTSKIIQADNAQKGTQLKLALRLEGGQILYFKPKRYQLSDIITGNVYAGFDRHNSEVFAYYLAMAMNLKWIAPSVIRKVDFYNEIMPVATPGLRRTMVKYVNGTVCVYGKCFYCRKNVTVCPDEKDRLEGAAILYFNRQFKIHKNPWRRSYNNNKMEWEIDNVNFCKKVSSVLSQKRILNLIDIAILDFLIQNGDRHRYEVYKNQIVILDNGKGLGNPAVDDLNILAPFYQCCILSVTTWQHLELLTGGSLTDTVKSLSALQGEHIATDEHYRAVERRLLKVFATIQYCIGKHGSANVFKDLI